MCIWAHTIVSTALGKQVTFTDGKGLSKVFVFVFYCYITNYDKLNGLKQHTFIISWFHGSEVQMQLNWILGLGSHMAAIKASPGLGSHLENELEKECTSKLTEIAGRIHFLDAIQLRALVLAGCWLEPHRGCLQFLATWTFPSWLLTSYQQGGTGARPLVRQSLL